MRRPVSALIALLLAAGLASNAEARHRATHAEGSLPPGLPPGRYSLRIVAPTLLPSVALDQPVADICYSREDARVHANPIMPAPERADCTQHDLMIGNVLSFDDTCRDGLHNLRLAEDGPDSYSGKYLYVSKGQPRLQLEPFVQLHCEGDCP